MTKTGEMLIAQLKENTGRALCDSGGAYGRNWERNQGKDFLSESPTVLEFNMYSTNDGKPCIDISITHNVFHWLNDRLEYDGDMTRKLKNFARRKEYDDGCWLAIMEAFAEQVDSEYFTINTSDGEDLLSQTIQYVLWYDDGVEYVALQIHGGCDVRGGYTAPKVYRVCGSLYDNAYAQIYCPECNAMWETDDGYYWSPNSEYMSGDIDGDLFGINELGDHEPIDLLNISPNVPSWSKAGKNGELYNWVSCEEFPSEPGKRNFYVNGEGQGLCPYCGKEILEGACR